MKRILMIAALSAALISPALAQGIPCGPPEVMLDIAKKERGEKPFIAGLAGEDTPVVLLVNIKTGSWTFFAIAPNALCVIASGSDFRQLSFGDPA